MKTLSRFCGILLVTLVILTALAGVSSHKASAGTVGRVVDLVLLPANPTVNGGATLDITIQVQPSGQDVVGADVFLDFNPAHLEVVAIKPGTTLSMILQNKYDNTAGTIDYSGGTTNQPFPSATFTLATVTFKAKSVAVSTAIAFHGTSPRETLLTEGNFPVLRSKFGTTVNIQVPGAPAPTPTATTPPASPTPTATPAPAPATKPPTASPTPTPTPSPAVKPTPTITPSPTPTPKPSASPSPASPTPAPAPSEEGPNWFFIGGGIAVALVLGLGIWFALTCLERD